MLGVVYKTWFTFQTNGSFVPSGINGEYQAKQLEAGFGYQNSAYAYSQPHLSTLAVTKYAPSAAAMQAKYLKRSASSVSQFVSASRMSGLNDIQHAQYSHQKQLNVSETKRITLELKIMERTFYYYQMVFFTPKT